MKELVQEKKKAITFRKKGYSYKEILKEVPVAKSTLSAWLKDLPLTRAEKQVLKKRKNSNISRSRIKAAATNRQKRLDREKVLWNDAKKEFDLYINDTLFHTGVVLYWAEGTKRNSVFHFMNSDYEMIKIMLLWIETYTNYHRNKLGYRLYIHKPYAHENCENWWSGKLNVSERNFRKTIYKPTGSNVKKRPQYKGCLRIEVPTSKSLLCKMKFWQQMIVECYSKE